MDRNFELCFRVELMEQINQDYDSPWKDILETYFRQFLAFFFPLIENDLNWEKGYEFLDKEFQSIVKEAEIGRRYLDKLIRVWRKDDLETWLLIHIEVQGASEIDFPEWKPEAIRKREPGGSSIW